MYVNPSSYLERSKCSFHFLSSDFSHPQISSRYPLSFLIRGGFDFHENGLCMNEKSLFHRSKHPKNVIFILTDHSNVTIFLQEEKQNKTEVEKENR